MKASPTQSSPHPPNRLPETPFPSFFLGGFECSTHKRRDGRRLDLVAASRHDVFLRQDYQRLREVGIRTAREGLRWHLIEARPGEYDFASVRPFIKAAREEGILVIWDILHFGWPDFLDVFSPTFVDHFAGLAEAFARFLAEQGEAQPWLAPVNEPSFVSWGGGDVAYINPFERGRGDELKRQLVRAHLEATECLRRILPQAHILAIDPVINIVPDVTRPQDLRAAEEYTHSQFQALNMMRGAWYPELEGYEGAFDVVGLNFYPRNQWVHEPHKSLRPGDPQYVPLRKLLRRAWRQYRRPLFLAETGTEDEERAPWLRYVCDEVWAAIGEGTPVWGICLYPILNHPGWDDDRHCYNGLWDYADDDGNRVPDAAYLSELRYQQQRFDSAFTPPAMGSGTEGFSRQINHSSSTS